MLDIVIVNWNSGDQLKDCLESIYKFADSRLGEVVVVDNDSSDSSIEVAYCFEKVRVICSDNNLGFGKACNLAAKELTGKYILFLNPDAVLHEYSLEKVLNYMDSKAGSEFDICGIQLINENNQVSRSCSRFPTPLSFIFHSFGLDKVFRGMGHLMIEWDHMENRTVDHVIGAFFFIRRSLFDEINGFDERFFLYLEDVDFSLRAKQAGGKTIYFAEADAFHAGGGTSKQIKAKRLFYSIRSRLVYAELHFSKLENFFVKFSAIFVEPISRGFFSLLSLSLPAFKETCDAYSMLWRWLLQEKKGVS